MPQNSIYHNQVIWITGASGGLGRELAIQLSEGTTKLILSARQQEKLLETQKLANLSFDRCLILPLDLTSLNESKLKEAQNKILEKFGKLDIIIHNASLSQRSQADKTKEEVDRKIMETIFFGPVKMTKYFLSTLLKSQNPRLVIISSLAGKFGVPLRSSYCAAKHALHGFFEAMRIEQHGKIKISFFILGGVKTESAMHALNGDGTVHNQLDQWHDRNMCPQLCASMIIQRIPEKKSDWVIGRVEKLGLWLKAHFPTLHQKILLHFYQKELNNLESTSER